MTKKTLLLILLLVTSLAIYYFLSPPSSPEGNSNLSTPSVTPPPTPSAITPSPTQAPQVGSNSPAGATSLSPIGANPLSGGGGSAPPDLTTLSNQKAAGLPEIQTQHDRPSDSHDEDDSFNPADYRHIYGIFHTNLGSFKVEFFLTDAPETVRNFVELAEGKKMFFDFQSGMTVKRRFFDGLTFHRVIKKHFIQGGDPIGNGKGGPGFNVRLEVSKKLRFNKPGRLASVNTSDGGSNGSQFFITVSEAEWLDGTSTIFAQVISGMPVVQKLSQVKTDVFDRPQTPIRLERVEFEKILWKGQQPKYMPSTEVATPSSGVSPTPESTPTTSPHRPHKDPTPGGRE